jgi:hypothetical protein
MKGLYKVFHAQFLKKTHRSELQKKIAFRPPPRGHYYDVDAVISHRLSARGAKEYFVRFTGHEDDQWLPADRLNKAALDDYEQSETWKNNPRFVRSSPRRAPRS